MADEQNRDSSDERRDARAASDQTVRRRDDEPLRILRLVVPDTLTRREREERWPIG